MKRTGIVALATLIMATIPSIALCQSQGKSEKTMIGSPNIDKIKGQIVTLIREKQEDYIKKSSSEYNCFTDKDYEEYHSNETLKKIVDKLKSDSDFLSIKNAIADLDSADQKSIYREGRKTYKKTWSEIGKIGPEGQTDAGSRAEKEIAGAIIDLLEELIATSKRK